MITYVNTVFVSNKEGAAVLTAMPAATTTNAVPANYGDFILMNCDESTKGDATKLYTVDATTNTFKIGMITKNNATIISKADGSVKYQPIVRWSNEIKAADIRDTRSSKYAADTEDVVTLDFSKVVDANTLALFAEGGKRIIVRLTFKDLPTRYRKWTESYEYVTEAGDDMIKIAAGIAKQINLQYKRARVTASAAAGVLTLTALPYDDDNVVDSYSWAGKVRFVADCYYTDPAAAAFASRNKYFLPGMIIEKTPGVWSTTSAKLVRDRESQGMGYDGIMNRTWWPIIKPDMETKLDGKYNGLTFQFENTYRAADDIFRKTKQNVEVYATDAAICNTIATTLKTIAADTDRATNDIAA